MPEVDWSRMKAQELRALAAQNAVVILPIASIEQHGPHLPVMTDTRLGQEVAHRAARMVYDRRPTVVTPVVWSGLSEAGEDMNDLLEDQGGMMHACEAETSMMVACQSDLVDSSGLASLASDDGLGAGFLKAGKASYRWRSFSHITANGVAGNPIRANAEKGEKLIEVSAEALANLIADPATWAVPNDLRGEGTAGVPFFSAT